MRMYCLLVGSVTFLLLPGTEAAAQGTITIVNSTAKDGSPGFNFTVPSGNLYFIGFSNNSKLYDGLTVSGPRGTSGITAGKTNYPGTTIPQLYFGSSKTPIQSNYVMAFNNYLQTFGYGNLSPKGLKKK